MFISQLFATSWIAFSVGRSVHDDYELRRRLNDVSSDQVGANFWVGDDDQFCSGINCGRNCWRPLWCKLDTRTCGGETYRRCGAQCLFPRCRSSGRVCPTDVKTCRDGTVLNRDPETCDFPSCPRPPSCSPSLGFKTCEDGSRVGRDPNNLCITWLPCPAMFTCADGWQKIRMDLVCNGRRHCNDGSDEWLSHGCQQFGVGRRLDEETPSTEELKLDASPAIERRLSLAPSYNCWTYDSQRRWTVGKQRWCCDTYSIACQHVPERNLCANKRCGDVCDNTDGFLQVMRYCQPDGTCSSNATPACPGPALEPYNCYTRERWTNAKRRWCCANKNLGCRGGNSESEYTPGGEYNCRFGTPSSWTWQKSRFCCNTKGIGCTPTSGGPSIGRRAEIELNDESQFDQEE